MGRDVCIALQDILHGAGWRDEIGRLVGGWIKQAGK